MSRQSSRPPAFHALSRAVSWHRRKLAVVAAVAAVLTGVNAALPPDPPSMEVVRAVTRLDGGVVIAAADVKVARVPLAAVPEGALTETRLAVGKTLTAPVAQGAMLTALSVVSPSRSVRAGDVVAPLRLADSDLAALLHVGDAVDVVAADTEAPQALIVARGVRVIALPQPPDPSRFGGGSGSTTGALVLVEVDSKTATTLAQAAVTATLSVVLR